MNKLQCTCRTYFTSEARTMTCAIPFINCRCPSRVLTTWNEVSVTAVLCCGTLYPKRWEKLNQSGNLKSKSIIYLSRRTLTRQSCKTVVLKLKSHFARYRCPDQVISDNRPLFTSHTFQKFPGKWEFEHITSNPGNPKANGKAKSAIKTPKNLLLKTLDNARDPYMAILGYRNTPTQGLDASLAQRLMSQRFKTLLPTARSLLQPRVMYPERDTKLWRKRQTETANYNHRVRGA